MMTSRVTVKYLGEFLECGLTFNHEYEYIAERSGKLLSILLALRQNVCRYSNNARKMMLKLIIEAIHWRASSVFAHWTQANQKFIEKLDRRIAQWMYVTSGYYAATVIIKSWPLPTQALKRCHMKGWPIQLPRQWNHQLEPLRANHTWRKWKRTPLPLDRMPTIRNEVIGSKKLYRLWLNSCWLRDVTSFSRKDSVELGSSGHIFTD